MKLHILQWFFLLFVQVLVLRNFGLLVGGETIEEAFWMARNVMTGVNTQVTKSLLPGFHSHVPSVHNIRAVAVVPFHSYRCLRTNGKNRSRSYCNGMAATAVISNGIMDFFT